MRSSSSDRQQRGRSNHPSRPQRSHAVRSSTAFGSRGVVRLAAIVLACTRINQRWTNAFVVSPQVSVGSSSTGDVACYCWSHRHRFPYTHRCHTSTSSHTRLSSSPRVKQHNPANLGPAHDLTSGESTEKPRMPELNHDEIRRYSRHLILPDVGVTGQRRLKASSVLAVGTGGLGSPALLYLAAAGVGRLGIVDNDIVDESNLQRQVSMARVPSTTDVRYKHEYSVCTK